MLSAVCRIVEAGVLTWFMKNPIWYTRIEAMQRVGVVFEPSMDKALFADELTEERRRTRQRNKVRKMDARTVESSVVMYREALLVRPVCTDLR